MNVLSSLVYWIFSYEQFVAIVSAPHFANNYVYYYY